MEVSGSKSSQKNGSNDQNDEIEIITSLEVKKGQSQLQEEGLLQTQQIKSSNKSDEDIERWGDEDSDIEFGPYPLGASSTGTSSTGKDNKFTDQHQDKQDKLPLKKGLQKKTPNPALDKQLFASSEEIKMLREELETIKTKLDKRTKEKDTFKFKFFAEKDENNKIKDKLWSVQTMLRDSEKEKDRLELLWKEAKKFKDEFQKTIAKSPRGAQKDIPDDPIIQINPKPGKSQGQHQEGQDNVKGGAKTKGSMKEQDPGEHLEFLETLRNLCESEKFIRFEKYLFQLKSTSQEELYNSKKEILEKSLETELKQTKIELKQIKTDMKQKISLMEASLAQTKKEKEAIELQMEEGKMELNKLFDQFKVALNVFKNEVAEENKDLTTQKKALVLSLGLSPNIVPPLPTAVKDTRTPPPPPSKESGAGQNKRKRTPVKSNDPDDPDLWDAEEEDVNSGSKKKMGCRAPGCSKKYLNEERLAQHEWESHKLIKKIKSFKPKTN